VQAAPPRTFTIYEEDDGWETIQDAQNAAALFVLFSVSILLAPLPCTLSQKALSCGPFDNLRTNPIRGMTSRKKEYRKASVHADPKLSGS